jgi:PAS domain S-box-containing protein
MMPTAGVPWAIALAAILTAGVSIEWGRRARRRLATGVRSAHRIAAPSAGDAGDATSPVSEQQLRILLATLAEMTDHAYAFDRHGRILFANQALLTLWGVTLEQAVGRTLGSLGYPDALADTLERQIRQVVAVGQRITDVAHYTGPGGIAGYYEYGFSPARAADGTVDFVVGSSRDITARKEAEDHLRDREELLRLITNLVPHGIFAKDAAGRHIFANPALAEMAGLSVQEMLGRDDFELVADRSQAEAYREDDRRVVLSGAQLLIPEEPRTDLAGRTRYLQTIKLPFIVASTGETAILGVCTDITEPRRMRRELEQAHAEMERRVVIRTAELEAANRELEAFSYSVSHDLRAPLRAINGFAGIVVSDFGIRLPADALRYLERIRMSADRMSELIDDLLAFSRLGRQAMTNREVDSAALVREILAESVPSGDGRHPEIRVGDLPVCRGDAALLRQVWINLIGNAIKYTGKRDPAIIEIGCQRTQDADVFFVRDNGAGFDMQYAHKLFGVFQRLHRADEFEGSGVGLAIAQRIVHRHGGRIWAVGAEEHGATFSFTIDRGATP